MRNVKRAAPTVVWLMAIGVAFYFWDGFGHGGTIIGLGEDLSTVIAPGESGIVRQVHVDLHQSVDPGQIILTMDDRQERIRLAALRSDIKRLHGEVAAAEAQLTADNARAHTEGKDLERRFLWDRETAHLEYLEHLLTDARDRIQLRGVQVEFERVSELYKSDRASPSEFNEVKTLTDTLKDRVERNAGVAEQFKKHFDAADRRWFEYSNRQSDSVDFDPVLTPLRLAVEVRKRDLEELVFKIDAHVLRSPIQGQVTILTARPGMQIDAGVVVAAISPSATRRVVAYLPEQMARSVRIGAKVSAIPIARDFGERREHVGTVTSLSTALTEAPPRFRRTANQPFWGRELIVTLQGGSSMLPGEAAFIKLSSAQ